MRKVVLLFLFISSNIVAYNQIIRGTVTDQNTHDAIEFASIYINGTFVGTHSDQNGYFELDVSEYKSMPLTINALGYYPVILTDFLSLVSLSVQLSPKVFELTQVTIRGKEYLKVRRNNLKLFREAFLGVTQNASRTKILNEKNIQFYNSTGDTLSSYTSGPIRIKNRELGYNMTYFLEEFKLNRKNKNFFFTGDIFFEKDLGTGAKSTHQYEEKRRRAYLGSKMHFFRSLWADESDSDGFEIRGSGERILSNNDIVLEEDNQTKFLCYPGKLVIYYQSVIPSGYINFLKDMAFFDKSGYFDPLSMAWDGEMAQQRIADQLPYEYKISK